MFGNKKLTIAFILSCIFSLNLRLIESGCPVTDNPSQMFQCLTINPQAFIDLISKGDYKSFCHMANGYMTCMTTYVRDCLGGKAATGILEELQDLNLKCCISGRSQDCVVKSKLSKSNLKIYLINLIVYFRLDPALLSKCYAPDNLITLANGETKRIMDSNVGEIVKAIDSNGNLIDTEIVSIMHKNSNSTSNLNKCFNLTLLKSNFTYFKPYSKFYTTPAITLYLFQALI